MSIARLWTGATRSSDVNAYLAYLERTGFAEYVATPGNEGVLCLVRVADGRAEFTLLSLWHDRAAVEAFAGPVAEKAVFYPEDDAFLVRRDETVTHHEVTYVKGAGAFGAGGAGAGKRGAGAPGEAPPGESGTAAPGVIGRLVRWWSERAARGLRPLPDRAGEVRVR